MPSQRESLAIEEMRRTVFSEQAGVCWWCRGPLKFSEFELAHRIPQRKWCLKRWGKEVIHHRYNLVGTHRGTCNSAVQLNPDSQDAERLAREIKRVMRRENKR